MFFESVAFAAAPPANGAAGGAGSLLAGPLPMLILMFAIFYFLLIRPQQKKAKEHKLMLENLQVGDVVWTNGGIKGVIKIITDEVLTLEIADGVDVEFQRGYVAGKFDPNAGKEQKKDKK
ncbi:preprotein translocase subunit YajC [Salidesulfovibrio brasiliensis]|uniref:preprotein translocase subunit YajC n=1 Tax=Salidesulfovibrio brasiliensis TaxID=221711 RepID=UPI0006D095B5|nr:preprotein translocase subunit YajC [Salidesulfovibrio brasiliensis]